MHIGDVAGVLSYGGNGIEDLRDVREVEVSTDRERLRTPVTTPYHGMHIGQATLARGAVAKVPHEAGACEGEMTLGIGYVAEAIGRCMDELGMDGIEDLLYGGGAFGTLTEEVFVTGLALELDDGQACALLPAVVLLLHQEVELVEPIHPRTILLLVVAEGLTQADHSHATFMLEGFHLYLGKGNRIVY